MSRQIKFRAWDSAFKQMCQVSTIHFLENDEPSTTVEAHGLTSPFGYRDVDVSQHPLMQFTGLQDILKTDIYHKDIVEVDGEIGVVEWNASGAYWCVVFDEHSSEYLYWAIDATRILGNVYEHPEFLIKQP
jgi:uncharacterized phage protein (TIGR01671 family)